MIRRLALFFCLCALPLFAENGVTVDLRNPVYSDGILTTFDGGVIRAPNIRIQAQCITYSNTEEEGLPVRTVSASKDVMIQYGDYIFVGDYLEYDFVSCTGVIYCGKTTIPPWYFGGEAIYLFPNGNYRMENGFITTSESDCPGWKIATKSICINDDKDIDARDVKFRYGRTTLFWLPRLKINLNTIFDHPIRYSLRWSGPGGPRLRMIYEVFNWNNFKTFLRFDYRITRGPGGGVETYYHSPDHRTFMETINYIARDNAIEEPNEKVRYRYQGVFHKQMFNDRFSIDMGWDKLSDKDMATDYRDKGLELDTACRTELRLRQQQDLWIANLLARVRINDFQTVNQQLPTFEARLKPYMLGPTRIMSESMIRASYLDFEYANDQLDQNDFNSPRVEMGHVFYRGFHTGPLNFTPFGGGIAIFYGNNRQHLQRWAALLSAGGEVNSPIYRFYENYKHVAIPYASYRYDTFPTTPPNDHFIFDITDGQYRLDMLRFGVRNHMYVKDRCGLVRRLVYADIFANAFFDTETIPSVVPKVYSIFTWHPTERLKQTLDTAWDFSEQQLDHINIRNEWTINRDAALALEYRHRDKYDWRKSQKQNFILDSFRPVSELVNSSLSDRRDTILFRIFWRYTPTWALNFDSRWGWNRRFEPSYGEYNINLVGTISSAWTVRLGYRHQEDEDRFAIFFNVGINRPDTCNPCYIPSVEF